MVLKSWFQQVKYDETQYVNVRCQLWIEEKKRKKNISHQSAKVTSVMCYSDIIYAHELAEKWVVLFCMYVFWLDSKLVIWRNVCRSHSHHKQFTWTTRGKQMFHIHHHQPHYHVQTPHGLLKKCAHGDALYQTESFMHVVSKGGCAGSHKFEPSFLYRDDLEIKPCERYG